MAERNVAALEWALRELRDSGRQGRYAKARAYYDGVHRMMFATEKFKSTFGKTLKEVADNLCPAVVDSVADRLKVTGIGPGEDGSQEVAEEAWDIWQRNRMDLRAPETHHDALLDGDGYAITWPDEAGDPVIWSIPACDMVVSYDPTRPGQLRRAARVWRDDDDGRVHVDVYLREQVDRWVTRTARRQATLGSTTRARDFVPYALDANGLAVLDIEPNPWGVVPVVHFPNLAFHGYGRTELHDVFPLQDALNKTLCDLLVSNEFAAYRQRWATGYDASDNADATDGNISAYGVDRMMWSSDPGTRFGNFDASEAQGFLETIENLRSEIARVSGTPLHYLFITRGDFPSGEAMKSAEARFTRKVEKRQTAFGNQWEDLLALAVRQANGPTAPALDGAALSLEWESAEPTGLNTPPAAGPTDENGQRSSSAPPAPPADEPPAA